MRSHVLSSTTNITLSTHSMAMANKQWVSIHMQLTSTPWWSSSSWSSLVPCTYYLNKKVFCPIIVVFSFQKNITNLLHSQKKWKLCDYRKKDKYLTKKFMQPNLQVHFPIIQAIKLIIYIIAKKKGVKVSSLNSIKKCLNEGEKIFEIIQKLFWISYKHNLHSNFK